jgi:hypothetical protein
MFKGDRVRHIDKERDKRLGVMSILEIKNENAVCGYLDYSRLHEIAGTFLLTELKKDE